MRKIIATRKNEIDKSAGGGVTNTSRGSRIRSENVASDGDASRSLSATIATLRGESEDEETVKEEPEEEETKIAEVPIV